MTADSQLAVQIALFDHLSADAALIALLPGGGIYDYVPRDADFPYVVLGDMTCRPANTMGGEGMETVFAIETFSRSQGHRELRSIMAEIARSLNNPALEIEGHHFILCRFLGSETRVKKDGKTRKGTQRFLIVTEV